MTELHSLSGLANEHHSRRTDTGFVIRARRLPRCLPLPASKTGHRSWVWDQEIYLGQLNDHNEALKHWLCKICYEGDIRHPLSTYLICTEKTTTKVIDHLAEFHQFDRLGKKLLPIVSKKRKQASLEAWGLQQQAHHTVLDEEGWKSTYCRCVISSGISLRQATSVEFKALLCFQNPRVEGLIPQSHTTTGAWAMNEYTTQQRSIIQSIASAKGKVAISFDGWKANNDVLDPVGVVVHYLGDDYKLHNVVLAMRDTLGNHTGANIADHLFDVLTDY